MPPTVQEFGTVQDPNLADKQACFEFVDNVIQYVKNNRYSTHPPLVRLDGTQSFSVFGRNCVRFVNSPGNFDSERVITNVVAECRRIPRNEQPAPVLRYVRDLQSHLARGCLIHCLFFLLTLCTLCLKLEYEGMSHFAQTAAAFGKFLIGCYPDCLKHFLRMRNQA